MQTGRPRWLSRPTPACCRQCASKRTPWIPWYLSNCCTKVFICSCLAGKQGEHTLTCCGSPDEKLPMEQVQQDDLQVQEGTVEKTTQGSDVPECKHECRLLKQNPTH